MHYAKGMSNTNMSLTRKVLLLIPVIVLSLPCCFQALAADLPGAKMTFTRRDYPKLCAPATSRECQIPCHTFLF